jgi:hypothetical protein
MFALTPTTRPTPTVLISTTVTGCGSVVERSVRGGDVAGSNPATRTNETVRMSEDARMPANGKDTAIRAAKREVRTDN